MSKRALQDLNKKISLVNYINIKYILITNVSCRIIGRIKTRLKIDQSNFMSITFLKKIFYNFTRNSFNSNKSIYRKSFLWSSSWPTLWTSSKVARKNFISGRLRISSYSINRWSLYTIFVSLTRSNIWALLKKQN